MRTQKSKSQAGFSLLETMVVVLILTIVMGVVINQIVLIQKRNQIEESRLDVSQESREYFDQIVHDLHQSGYPSSKMFGTGILTAPEENDAKAAVGLVKFAYDEVWFEADIDGDGTVDVIDYKLQTDGVNGSCPCRISRSQAPKANATAPMAQTATNFTTELQDVVNSGGANGGVSGTAAYTITGTTHYLGGSTTTVANDTLYAPYKTANIFTAYNGSGALVAPTDYATNKALLASIRTIRINVNLLTPQGDLQTGVRPAVTLSSTVRIPSN
jgi:prepilin-type N-terminal cleavage/methylation domain-containing protein